MSSSHKVDCSKSPSKPETLGIDLILLLVLICSVKGDHPFFMNLPQVGHLDDPDLREPPEPPEDLPELEPLPLRVLVLVVVITIVCFAIIVLLYNIHIPLNVFC